jgi:hypothetical protein
MSHWFSFYPSSPPVFSQLGAHLIIASNGQLFSNYKGWTAVFNGGQCCKNGWGSCGLDLLRAGIPDH